MFKFFRKLSLNLRFVLLFQILNVLAFFLMAFFAFSFLDRLRKDKEDQFLHQSNFLLKEKVSQNIMNIEKSTEKNFLNKKIKKKFDFLSEKKEIIDLDSSFVEFLQNSVNPFDEGLDFQKKETFLTIRDIQINLESFVHSFDLFDDLYLIYYPSQKVVGSGRDKNKIGKNLKDKVKGTFNSKNSGWQKFFKFQGKRFLAFYNKPVHEKFGLVFVMDTKVLSKWLNHNNEWDRLSSDKSESTLFLNEDLINLIETRHFLESPETFGETLTPYDSLKKFYETADEPTTVGLSYKEHPIGQFLAKKSTKGIYSEGKKNFLFEISKMEWFNHSFYIVSSSKEKSFSEFFEKLFAYSVLQVFLLILIGMALIALGIYAFGRSLIVHLEKSVVDLFDPIQANTLSVKDLQKGSHELNEATQTQASALQETAATLNEISQMVQKTFENVDKSSQQATQNAEISHSGGEVIEQMLQAIQDIHKSNENISQQIVESNQEFDGIINLIKDISKKTEVINDIVFQTKLLSFNASVEAARAGEHGKGFSVVAEEVGALAQTSGSASDEIGALVANSVESVEKIIHLTQEKINDLVESAQKRVESATIVAKRCGEILGKIMGNSTSVSQALQNVREATKEQAEGVKNISQAMNDIQSVNKTTTDVAERTLRTSEELLQNVNHLKSAHLILTHFVEGRKEEDQEPRRSSSSREDKPLKKFKQEKEQDVYPNRDDDFEEF